MWSHISCLRSPKEEPYVAADRDLSEIRDGFPMTNAAHKLDILGEFEDIFGTEDDETLAEHLSGDLEWGAMEWEQLPSEGLIEEDDKEMKIGESLDEVSDNFIIKRENLGFWEEKKSLALNLNYQEVLDAWSDRGPLWAHDTSLLTANHAYGGEVPIMEMEEERSRREARVLRYKEKRQSRLFSKKIRYQVRKINAENRPRLKGRFVKSIPENVMR